MEYSSTIHAALIGGIMLAGLLSCRAAESLPYSVASWPDNLGNQRARIQVMEKADAVRTHIVWRRRDSSPQEKNIVVFDAATGAQVRNVARADINREYGDIVFQPNSAGEYHVYYMPCTVTGPEQWAFTVTYEPPASTADPAWLERNGLNAEHLADGKWKSLPEAEALELQARSEFSRPDPMEVIATSSETEQLLAKYPDRACMLFPEDRQHPIRMTDDLPLRWIESGPKFEFQGEAQRNEFYVFQVGVFAARKAISDLSVEFGDLRSRKGKVIPARALRCFNTGGTDWLGRPIRKSFAVEAGKIGALWLGVQVPRDAVPGEYKGALTIKPAGDREMKVSITLKVADRVLEDCGDSDLWRLSRLRWLDSTIGLDDEVTAPYTPIEVHGDTTECLGRQVKFGPSGLPSSIRSSGLEILARPMDMVVETSGGTTSWSRGKAKVVKSTAASAVLESSSESGDFSLGCTAKMDFDGYTNFSLKLKTLKSADVKDVRLEIPIRRDIATYMMGLGRKGGYRPAEWGWTWDMKRANNMVWIGDVKAGLQCKLKGPRDTWDIYDLSAGGIPESWGNGGKGGCTIQEEGSEVVIRAYSGERRLKAGEEIEFRFGMLVTPVKPLDPAHWNQRYYHAYVPPETAIASGANIINIHHGNDLNPYINYPFLTTDKLSAYVRDAHEKGVKVKVYYTVRELSNHVAEMWALRSLGYEVFTDGRGGGHSWLREHLVSHYAPAWHQPLPDGDVDAAIATTGLSRWHNYYLEGLGWLVKNVGIDGLYLDGIGYDREIMRRVRKVMDRARPGCLIDFHSGNEFPFNDLRVSPANKYMEHFPYINSLWFGEGYDYNESPDYWLVEVSGIPFGLFGEMLHENGNPWRGMVYGMTARYYSGADPKHIWKLWDDFGIQDAEMIGYWSPECPVRTDNKDVLATVYRGKARTLVSLASWAKGPVRIRLAVDWKAIGIDPAKARITAPAVTGFQEAASFLPSDEIPVEPGKGWLLVLDGGG